MTSQEGGRAHSHDNRRADGGTRATQLDQACEHRRDGSAATGSRRGRSTSPHGGRHERSHTPPSGRRGDGKGLFDYAPHLPKTQLVAGLESSQFLMGRIRINPSRTDQAFLAIAALPFDIFIGECQRCTMSSRRLDLCSCP